jgi:hypothetical protein
MLNDPFHAPQTVCVPRASGFRVAFEWADANGCMRHVQAMSSTVWIRSAFAVC